MKRIIPLLSLIASLSLPLISGHAQAQNASASASDAMTNGEIRKIDKETGKITIKHEEIKNLDMPSMTMVFQIKDKAMLEKVKINDKIKFKASSENGKLTVTEINSAK
jgi:Cu(I)/Ag(I) efflux system periplasmic protein CusF